MLYSLTQHAKPSHDMLSSVTMRQVLESATLIATTHGQNYHWPIQHHTKTLGTQLDPNPPDEAVQFPRDTCHQRKL